MIRGVLTKAILDIDSYYGAKENLIKNKDFADNLAKLSLQVEALKRILSLYEHIDTKGFKQESLLSDNSKTNLLGLLEECGNRINARNLEVSFVPQFTHEISNINTRLKENWPNTARKYAGDVSESLRNMSALLKEPEKANAVQEMILRLQNRWPITQNDITQFITKVKEGQALLGTLQIDDQEVEEFIKKLRSQQTTVADLNDNILAWIRKNDLESRIMVGFVAG